MPINYSDEKIQVTREFRVYVCVCAVVIKILQIALEIKSYILAFHRS